MRSGGGAGGAGGDAGGAKSSLQQPRSRPSLVGQQSPTRLVRVSGLWVRGAGVEVLGEGCGLSAGWALGVRVGVRGAELVGWG